VKLVDIAAGEIPKIYISTARSNIFFLPYIFDNPPGISFDFYASLTAISYPS
jgi:hypothetical protein